MAIENLRSNIVNVAVSGVTRVLNLEQVLFSVVGSSTSDVYVNEGASNPVVFTIEGDFRNLIAGIRSGAMNAAPLFGAFTDVSSKVPIVVNLNKINRYIAGNNVTFSKYGTVTAFTFNLLEPLVDVLGMVGLSLYDVGIFSVNKTGNTLSAPVQANLATAATGGTIADNTYFVKVTATNAAGETIGSNEKSVTTTGGGLSTITASWAATTYATGYKVYIGTSSGAENKVATITGGSITSLVLTALPGTSGTVPVSNTAVDTRLNTQEFINIKNVTHQVPSGTNWTTTFTDASSVLYVESLQDLVGGP